MSKLKILRKTQTLFFLVLVLSILLPTHFSLADCQQCILDRCPECEEAGAIILLCVMSGYVESNDPNKTAYQKMCDDCYKSNIDYCSGKVTGGETPAPGGAVFKIMEYDTDRPGGDYRSLDLVEPRPELCENECAKDPQCKAYTYVKPGIQGPNARCWLKSSVPNSSANSCCISRVKEGTGSTSSSGGISSQTLFNLSGTWGNPDGTVINITQNGNKVTGNYSIGTNSATFSGTFDGTTVTVTYTNNTNVSGTIRMTLSGDRTRLDGSYTTSDGSQSGPLTWLRGGPTGRSGGSQTQAFSNPTVQGYRVDRCLHWAQQCDEPAASAWCRTQGYERATNWSWEYTSPTYVIGDGSVCNANYCGGFSSITCSN